MKIYIVRHGETEWNIEGRLQGWKNSDLTKKGIENAKKLGEYLNNISFDKIYCSPAGRAIQTANYIIGDRKLEITTEEKLKEMGFGMLEGLKHDEMKERYPKQQDNLWNNPHLYEPFKDGESYEDLLKRANEFIEILRKEQTGDNILVISHAAFIKALFVVIKNLSVEEFWSSPYMYDTCLTILEIQDNNLNLLLEADVSHLQLT